MPRETSLAATDLSDRRDTEEWSAPREVDGYRLLHLLGRGAMGSVYAAHDVALDRTVAMKFILAADFDSEARARFLVEAKALARLQHPNVLAVYRAGELDGRPFIVSELVDGQSLGDLAMPLPSERVSALALGLARGLAAVHRRGIVHRDLKPSNAMISAAGEVKLLDFGIAKLVPVPGPVPGAVPVPAGERVLAGDQHVAQTHPAGAAVMRTLEQAAHQLTRSGAIIGTPLYMAPEIWQGEPGTTRSDVYSLGALLFELATGVPPADGETATAVAVRVQLEDAPPVRSLAAELEPRLAAVIDRCLARSPAARFASGEEVLAALEAIVRPAAPATPVIESPYRGLLAFGADHRSIFFGRSADVHAIVDRLRAEPAVVVAAESGAGKSSVCRAGVLPALAAGAFGDRLETSSAELVPGYHPLTSLVSALARALGRDEARVAEELADPIQFARALRVERPKLSLIVLVDQLEELITLSEAEEAERTAELLAELVSAGPMIKLLAAARSDFIGRLAAVPGLGKIFARALYFLAPLGPDGVREAIVEPARAHGFELESAAMIDELVEAASGEGMLPLLQFAMQELWEQRDRDSKRLTESSLRALGGLAGCLARHGDRVLGAIRPSSRDHVRRILIALVTEQGTRRVRSERELFELAGQGAEAIEALVRGRLVVARELGDGVAGYELTHEALISEWPVLREWLEGDLQQRILRGRVERAAAEWSAGGESEDSLWSARLLAETAQLERNTLRPQELEFLAASAARARRARLRRFAAWIGVPAIMLAAAAPIAKREYDRARAISFHLQEIAAQETAAKAGATAATAARAEAFREFDAADEASAESAWARALEEGRRADELYHSAIQASRRALDVDGDHPVLRATAVRLLHARLGLRSDRLTPAERDALEKDLASLDPALAAKLHAPAELSITCALEGVTVSVERHRLRDGRHQIEPAGVAGLGELRLEAGSIVVIASKPGHETVRHSIFLEPGKKYQLAIALPRAGSIPAGLIYIPKGEFLYGVSGDETMRKEFFRTQPLHAVRTRDYLIGRHEVTFAEWIEFLNDLGPAERARRMPRARQWINGVILESTAAGYQLTVEVLSKKTTAREGEFLEFPERDRRRRVDWRRVPVAAIDAEDAQAYLDWLKRTGRVPGARLCTDHEWERAARGADGRAFPGAENPGADDQNVDVTYGQKVGGFGPDEVGSHPASRSPFGVEDMSGNVWEWAMSVDGKTAVNRGGAWYMSLRVSRSANREPMLPEHRDPLLGLRVCADAPRMEVEDQ